MTSKSLKKYAALEKPQEITKSEFQTVFEKYFLALTALAPYSHIYVDAGDAGDASDGGIGIQKMYSLEGIIVSAIHDVLPQINSQAGTYFDPRKDLTFEEYSRRFSDFSRESIVPQWAQICAERYSDFPLVVAALGVLEETAPHVERMRHLIEENVSPEVVEAIKVMYGGRITQAFESQKESYRVSEITGVPIIVVKKGEPLPVEPVIGANSFLLVLSK